MSSPLSPNAAAILVCLGFAGCPQPVPTTCAAYIECQAAYDEAAGLPPVDTSSYDEGSACWAEPDSAQFCEEECQVGLEALIQAASDEGLDVPACALPADEALDPAASAIAPTSTAP
jgi:hypothetical protein